MNSGKSSRKLQEVNENQLKEIWNSSQIVITLAYTPICGTCQVAKRMLEVVSNLLPQVPFLQINLNYYGELAQKYEIMSVPCLMIHHQGECVEKVYTFISVPFLYKKITSYL